MPDQADVENALAQLATTALYSSGITEASAIGAPTRIFRGWPNAAALDADLAAGLVNVTIFPVPGATRVTTRYPTAPNVTPIAPSLTVSVSGNTVTFTGSAAPGQIAGVLVEKQSYVYRTAAGDTPELVAAILTADISAVRPATVTGATISIPGAMPIARSAADAISTSEIRRQIQTFRITAWCPTPDLRDATSVVLDTALAATPFLILADGSSARLTFVSTSTLDQSEDAALYRRDFLYTVEFPTTLVATNPSMLFGTLGVGADTITV